MPLGDQGYGSYVWDSKLNDWRKKQQSDYSPMPGQLAQQAANAQEALDMRNKRLEEQEIEKLNRKTALQIAMYNLEKAKLDWADFQSGYKR